MVVCVCGGRAAAHRGSSSFSRLYLSPILQRIRLGVLLSGFIEESGSGRAESSCSARRELQQSAAAAAAAQLHAAAAQKESGCTGAAGGAIERAAPLLRAVLSSAREGLTQSLARPAAGAPGAAGWLGGGDGGGQVGCLEPGGVTFCNSLALSHPGPFLGPVVQLLRFSDGSMLSQFGSLVLLSLLYSSPSAFSLLLLS